MPSAERVRERRYTEADVQALYLKYREKRIGPFVREIGDFIAHNKRDRGATLDATAFMFAQVAFFQTYQGINKIHLEPKGDCGWWLRHYLLTKAQLSKEKVLKKATGLNRKRAIRAIKSWFPENSSFPTKIECHEPALLHGLASVFSRMIISDDVFDSSQAKSELSRIFRIEGINNNELDRFLIATAVLLSGKSVEIVPGFTATIKLIVSEPRQIWLDENGRETTRDDAKSVRPLPDGMLKVAVHTENQTGDGLVGVALDLLNTNIDTETYFDRALVELDEHQIPRLNLDQRFSFEANRTPPVHG